MGRPQRHRNRRPAGPERPSRVGERHQVLTGPIAHGGHVVARTGGVVVFVRHALPGERVVVEITEGREGDRFLRGDAVEVLEAAEHRVEPPCAYAGPGRCGGCDFQHASPAYQRELKAAVVREQLSRLAGLDLDVTVEEVPPVLGWRTRMQYVDLPDGRRGLRKHRSHEVVEIDKCLIDAGRTEAATGTETVHGRTFTVDPGGFWQPHAAAPEILVDCLLEMLAPRPGESAVDLYAGVGVFAAFLGDAVGPSGAVTVVEGDRVAAGHAVENVVSTPVAAQPARPPEGPVAAQPARPPEVQVVSSDVQQWLEGPEAPEHADLVVLDPPRTGAKRRVVESIMRLSPRAVGYVACDPAALARDLAIFAEHGYALTALRAFDLFPMTHHVECVALLERRP